MVLSVVGAHRTRYFGLTVVVNFSGSVIILLTASVFGPRWVQTFGIEGSRSYKLYPGTV